MLIHAEGINRGDAPVKLYHVHAESGCVTVGDATTRIMLTPEEIRDLYKLLSPFVWGHGSCLLRADGDSQKKG